MTPLFPACLHTTYIHESPTQYLLSSSAGPHTVHLIELRNNHGFPAPSGGGFFLVNDIPISGQETDTIFTASDPSNALSRTRTLFNDNSSLSSHLKQFLWAPENQDKTFCLLSTSPVGRLAVAPQPSPRIDYEKFPMESAALIDLEMQRLIPKNDPQQLQLRNPLRPHNPFLQPNNPSTPPDITIVDAYIHPTKEAQGLKSPGRNPAQMAGILQPKTRNAPKICANRWTKNPSLCPLCSP